jgi:hypothetical protein
MGYSITVLVYFDEEEEEGGGGGGGGGGGRGKEGGENQIDVNHFREDIGPWHASFSVTNVSPLCHQCLYPMTPILVLRL